MKSRSAFTLAELVVVIAVIALLAALILPAMRETFTIARSRICCNNLRRISEATQTWATDNQTWDLQALVDGGWTSTAVRYGSGDILLCPEGGELVEGSPVEDQIVIRTSPTSSTAIPLVGLLEGGGFKVLKLSCTQWNAGEGKRMTPAPYVPDERPDVYWWGYDDGAIGSGDYDFQDLSIRVTKKGDGTADLYVIGATAGKPEVWNKDLTKQYASWQEINTYHNKSVTGVVFHMNVGGGSHYGMNDAVLDVRAPGKIQALDYFTTTAKSTDDWALPDYDGDKDARPDFLRHGGRANVLFLDGGVRTRSRAEIDPVDVEVERLLWQR